MPTKTQLKALASALNTALGKVVSLDAKPPVSNQPAAWELADHLEDAANSLSAAAATLDQIVPVKDSLAIYETLWIKADGVVTQTIFALKTSVRNAIGDAIVAQIGSGAKLRLYDG